MQKEIDNFELIQNVSSEIINSSKNNGTKYLLIFDDSHVQNINNYEEFVDNATAARHRGFSAIYIEHNFFHQIKLRRDVELQNTHIVLFKSPPDVHQVATLSVQLGLGSALVDWYRDATSVPFGLLLIDFSPRTDDRLSYCTNSKKIPSKFHVPDNLKHLKHMDDQHTKFFYSPSIPTLFPRIQNSRTVFKKNNLEATKQCTFVAKKIISPKNNLPFANNHLSWDGTICSSTSFCLQQQQQPNHCHKTRTTQIQTWANSHVPQGTLKKEINQQLSSTSASSLINKILESPHVISNTLILDGIKPGVLLKEIAQSLKRKNVHIPDIYFTLLDAANITPDLVVNSHAKGNEIGAWIPFKIWTTKGAEILHGKICSIRLCAQFDKSSETLSSKVQRVFIFKDFIY